MEIGQPMRVVNWTWGGDLYYSLEGVLSSGRLIRFMDAAKTLCKSLKENCSPLLPVLSGLIAEVKAEMEIQGESRRKIYSDSEDGVSNPVGYFRCRCLFDGAKIGFRKGHDDIFMELELGSPILRDLVEQMLTCTDIWEFMIKQELKV